MPPAPHILFPPFRLDLHTEELWKGTQALALRPKTFAVLRYLVEQAGRFVSSAELLQAVWPDVYVGEGMPRLCIRELRVVLGDDVKRPQYIETHTRRGYRFIAPLTTTPPVQSSKFQVPSLQSAIVGREAELAQLEGWLEKAQRGERQMVFVTGEPGIGKTTVVEAFLEQVAAYGRVWIGRGQCVEHYGAGEAYMPVLEALGRLCQEPEGAPCFEVLRQRAPTWLVQMPALLSVSERETLQREVQGATRERMLREMAEALEALTVERALILRLEDLHWSDVSTLELHSVLARRRERARLLVLSTYRPVEVLAREHPLRAVKQELHLHGQCQELALDCLSEAAVAEYLARRFGSVPSAIPQSTIHNPQSPVPCQKLAQIIHQRTEGNPLFMVTAVDHLVAQKLLTQIEGRWVLAGRVEEVEVGVPASIQQLIEHHVERLRPETQRLLEVASVAGVEFSAAAVAASLDTAVEAVEEQCEELVRRKQFLRASGTAAWPDGTVAARYSFVHALYQNVLYERVPAARRVRLHRQIGEREEMGYREQAREIAAELAMHFERGRDYRRAVRHLEHAGENTLRRSAYQEAVNHLTTGLELLQMLPDTPERSHQELRLQITLGPALMATKGQAAAEVGETYTRARELCQQLGETSQLFPVLIGLFRFLVARGDLETGRDLAEQCLALAEPTHDPALLLEAHMALGRTLQLLGEFVPARHHLEQGIALYNPQQHHAHATLYVRDPGVVCGIYAAHALWILGYPEQALVRSHDALTLAQDLAHPLSLALALHEAAVLHRFRREPLLAQERAEAAIRLINEQELGPYMLGRAMIELGWALAVRGYGEAGITQIHQGLDMLRVRGIPTQEGPYQLAEAYLHTGQAAEGLRVLPEGPIGSRLKGELLLHQSPDTAPAAEACFQQALAIARRQEAKSRELRAAMSLARLWQQQGKTSEAHQLLAPVYHWFTEGFDTKDLQEAKALLDELSEGGR